MSSAGLFEILSPGLLTTIQDLGRFGYGRYGVAPSGAMDSYSLRVANMLVGNPENQACLETTLLGLTIRILHDCRVAITGGDLQPTINKKPLAMWRPHVLKTGDILRFEEPRSGCRAYIAVAGGIKIKPVLGSCSTNLTSGFGGLEGRALKKDDILYADSLADIPSVTGIVFKKEWIPIYSPSWTLRVIWGPQEGDFSERAKQTFLGAAFQVSAESDRTGIRLQGPCIKKKPKADDSIISEGVIGGAIQVPGDGQPIIILSETVTGGYRKIAAVISADLPLLGQIKPGDRVAFKAISLDEAYACLLDREAKIGKAFKQCAACTGNHSLRSLK